MSNTDTAHPAPNLDYPLISHNEMYTINVQAEFTKLRFQSAIEIIDDFFGPDYSKKNPHLVAALLSALVAAFKS